MKYSLLMAVFERQPYLDRHLHLFARHPELFERIHRFYVYDDASPRPITVGPSGEGLPVTLLRGDENVGCIEARNRLARAALDDPAEAVIFLDDDTYFNDWSALLDELDRAFARGDSIVTLPVLDTPIRLDSSPLQFRYLHDFSRGRREVPYFLGGASAFTKQVLREVGMLDGAFFFAMEEEDFAYRCFRRGRTIGLLNGSTVIGVHDHGPGKESRPRQVYRIANRLLYHRKHMRPGPIQVLLNGVFLGVYLAKHRDLGLLRAAWRRYRDQRQRFAPDPAANDGDFLRFLAFRYLHLTPGSPAAAG